MLKELSWQKVLEEYYLEGEALVVGLSFPLPAFLLASLAAVLFAIFTELSQWLRGSYLSPEVSGEGVAFT